MRSRVRNSCALFAASDACSCSVDDAAIDRFLKETDQSRYATIVSKEALDLKLPLRFESEMQKLNFYAVLHLLNFASGYRLILKQATGSGAFESIIRLLTGCHLSQGKLDADWMVSVDAATIGDLMAIDMTVDKPHETLGAALSIVEASPAAAVAHQVASALQTTGQFLKQQKVDTLAEYVQRAAQEVHNIDEMLDKLAAIPALQDYYNLDNYEPTIHIMKKAQIMISEIQRQGMVFSWLESGDLTIFADNVVPSMMKHFGILLDNTTPCEDATQITLQQAVSIRAASIVAAERIVTRASELGFAYIGDEVDLDNYLWKVAKLPEYRQLPRYSFQDTIMF
jgi:hypothetical protein